MSDKLVVEIDSKDAEVAMRNLDRLTTAAEQMGKAFENTKGATSALRELRLMLTGIKGQGSSLDELKGSIQSLNSTAESLKRSFAGSIGQLGRVFKNEMAELKSIVQEAGLGIGKAATSGIEEGMAGAPAAIRKQGRTIAAAAKVEATRIYETMVAGQANAKIKDVGALFKLEEAGATLSPYHKQVLANWKKSSAETFRALKMELATESAQLEAAAKAENAALQARLQEMELKSKDRDNSLAGIYRRSLNRGSQAISRIKADLKTERATLEATVRAENEALQASLAGLEAESRTRRTSLAGIYAESLGRGNFAVAQVRAKLKAEAAELKATIISEESELQKALKAMEKSDALRYASLAEIYAGSLKRGKQNIAKVKAELKAQADEIVKANESELKRIQAQVSAASNAPEGVYQKFNARSGIAGSVVDTAKIAEVKQLSSVFKQLTIDGNDVHSMARGLASGFNLLWLTWGNLLPLFTGAGISFGLKKTFDIGSEVEYNIKFMEMLGQTTKDTAGAVRQALRDIDQDTLFSLTELSQAMVRLGQSGLTTGQALETLKPAAALATAGMVDLKTSTDLIIQAHALFGRSSADAAKTASQLFYITKSGVLNVEDLAGSLKYASESNTRFGKTLEESLVLLGSLASAGLKGASGGTALINFFQDLNIRSGVAAKAMRDLENAVNRGRAATEKPWKFSMFNADGSQKDALSAIEELRTQLQKLSNEDADKVLAKFGSDRGLRTWFAALRDGTDGLRNLRTELETLDPNEVFRAQKGLMDTTKGALDQLTSAFVGALDTVFDAHSAGFKQFIIDVRDALNSQEFLNAVNTMVTAAKQLYEIVSAATPAILLFFKAWAAWKVFTFGSAAITATAESILRLTQAMAAMGGVQAAAALTGTQKLTMGLQTATAIATGAASAISVAQASTGILVRGLAFLTGPIGAAIITLGSLGLAWWQLKSTADDALGKTNDIVIRNGTANIAMYDKEIRKIQELRATQGQAPDPYADLEAGVSVKQAALAKKKQGLANLDAALNDPKANKGTFGYQETLNKRKRLNQQIIDDESEINAMLSRIGSARLEDAANQAEAWVEQTDKENQERQRQEQEFKKMFGGGGGGGFGAERRTYQDIKVQLDNELAEIVKRNNKEREEARALVADKQAILEASHRAGLISEGEYQSELFNLIRTSENSELERTKASREAYTAKYLEDTNKILKAYREVQARTAKTPVDVEARENNLKELSTKLVDMGNTAETVLEGMDSDMAKLASKGAKDLKIAILNAEGAVVKLREEERKYWADDKAALDKIRELDAVSEKYRIINGSVFSLDEANKAAALAGADQAEKLNVKLAELDDKYQVAESAALSFMTSNIMALASGNTEITELYNKLRAVADAFKAARVDAGFSGEKSIQDRSLLAFEKARKEQKAKLASDLSDAVMTGLFEGGQAGKKKLRDVLVAELSKPIKLVADLVMNATVNGFMNSIGSNLAGSAVSSAAGGAAGSALSTVGGIGSAISAGTSAFGVGASYGVKSLFANGLTGTLTAGSQMIGAGSVMSGLGTIAGALAPMALGIGALVSIAKAKGETRTGGQFGVAYDGAVVNQRRDQTYTMVGQQFDRDFTGGANVALTNGQAYRLEGDPVAQEKSIRDAVSGTAKTINDLLEKYGSAAALTGFSAGLETSGKDRGGVFAGGILSTGATFGESGKGDNYAGTLYEKFSSNSPDFKAALENFTLDLQQATLQALQAATDLPVYVSRVIKDVDVESLGAEDVAKLLTTIGDLPGVLLQSVGTTRDQLVKQFAEGLAKGDAVAAGQSVADTLIASIENSLYTNAAGKIFDIVNSGIVAPMIDAINTGASVSEALSQATIDKTIERAKAQATALAELFNNADFTAAMESIRNTVGSALGQAGSNFTYIPQYQLPAAEALKDAATETQNLAEEAAKKMQEITDSLNSEKLQLSIDLLRAQGFEEQALAAERARAIEGYNAQQIALYDSNDAIRKNIAAIESQKAALERVSSLAEKYATPAQLANAKYAQLASNLINAGLAGVDELTLINLMKNATKDQIAAWATSIYNTTDLTIKQRDVLFDSLDILADLKSSAEETSKAIEESFKSSAENIVAYIRELTIGKAGLASPAELLANTKAAYMTDLAGAQGGDAKSAARLADSARAFIEAQKAFSASSQLTLDTITLVVSQLKSLNFVTDYLTGDPGALPAFANGGAFTNSIIRRPTAFDMGQMGESGPEAVMPLVNVGGSLGVRAEQDAETKQLLRDIAEELRLLREQQASATGATVSATIQAAERVAAATEEAVSYSTWSDNNRPELT